MTRAEFEKMLGKNIRRERTRSGFSMQVVGEMIGVHRNTIWRWEEDGACLSVWELRELALIFGVSIAALIGDLEAPDPTERKKVQSERDPPLSNSERQLYAVTPINKHKMLSERLRQNYGM